MAIKQIYLLFCLFFNLNCLTQKDNSRVFTIVQQNPEYPEGQAAFYKYLAKNLKYPTSLRDNGIDCASTYVKFIVEKDGSISNVEVIRGCKNKAYKKQLCQLMKNMPRWNPGKQEGKPVRVSLTLPFRIHLE